MVYSLYEYINRKKNFSSDFLSILQTRQNIFYLLSVGQEIFLKVMMDFVLFYVIILERSYDVVLWPFAH